MEDTKRYLVGYGRTDITPKESVPLSSYGNSDRYMSRAVANEFYSSCFAVTDPAGNTILLMTTDLSRGWRHIVLPVRKMICERTGIPEDRIMIAGSHTHRAPEMGNLKHPAIQRYIPYLEEQMTLSAQIALNDRRPARIFIGEIEAKGLNFVKHYYNVTPDGVKHYFGDCHGNPVIDATTRHATDADPTMHIVQFLREGAKDLVLVNWRAHPHIYCQKTMHDLTTDFIGVFRGIC